jgi:hypothetical protein
MALPVQSELLTKVYDRYESTDFHYGKPELNPLREMKPYEIRGPSDVEAQMMARIKARMQKLVDENIKKKLDSNLGTEQTTTDIVQNAAVGPAETLANVSSNLQQKKIELGGDPSDTSNMLFNLTPSDHFPAYPPSPIELEILPMFLSMPNIPENFRRGPGANQGNGPLLDEPYKMDCDGILENDKGEEEDGGSSNDDDDDDSDSNSNSSDNGDNGDNKEDSSDSEDSDNSDGNQVVGDDAANNDLDSLLDKVHDKLQNQDFALFQCASIELGFLKIILAILTVIKILKTIIDFVLSLLLPIIELIRLAVGAWLNPSNIAKMIQLIVMKIISLIVMIITMIIQMLWDLLNIDCLADSTQSIIDQIKKTLSGLDLIFSEFNGNFVATTLGKVNSKVLSPLSSIADQMRANIEDWKNADQTFNEMMKSLSSEELKATMSSALKSSLSPFSSRLTGVLNNAKSIVPQVESMKESIKGEKEKAAVAKQSDKAKANLNNILHGPSSGLTTNRIKGLRTS